MKHAVSCMHHSSVYMKCELLSGFIIEAGIIACHIMLHMHLLQAQRIQANTAPLLLARADRIPSFLSGCR